MIEYALLVASMLEYGNPVVSFLTIPKLYKADQCEVDRPKLLDRLEHPHDGEKLNSNVYVECVPVSADDAAGLAKSLENDLKPNPNYLLYADHYHTLAIKFRGSNRFWVLPNLQLSSRQVCQELGRASVRRLTGTKQGDNVIDEVFYNCVAMSASEAKEIIVSFKTGTTIPIDQKR